MTENTTATDKDQPASRQIDLQKVYLKDCSLESPASPMVFTKDWRPSIDITLTSQVNKISDDQWEVVLKVTAEAKQDGAVAMLTEVQQAGLFRFGNLTDQDREILLGGQCPGALYPYAREAISDLVTKAGFPPLLLQPINFELMYLQQKQQTAAKA